MDIMLEREEYKYLEKCCETAIEECVEAELSLPEYMPEILRIIKSSATPNIISCNTVGERVTVDGTCELRMIYSSEDGCIYSFSQSRPFTRYCENPAFQNAVDIRVKTGVSYVNCRATNTKRAEIKAGISIGIYAYGEVCESVAHLPAGCDIEEKCVPVSAMSLGCRKSRVFMMNDVFPVPKGEAAFIISSFATAVTGETRKISNKVMVKGEAAVEISYIAAADKTNVEHARFTMPVNQILEFDGMDEKFTGDITLNVVSTDVIIKNDSSGEGHSFDVSLGITAAITMWEEKEFFAITDAYSVSSSLNLTKAPMKFYSALDEIRETYIYKNSLDISGAEIESVLDITCADSEPSSVYKNGKLCICGTLKLSMIYRSSDGSVITTEKMMDYCFEKNAEYECEAMLCMPNVTVTAFDCALSGNKSVDVRAEMQIICTVFSESVIETVTDITESEISGKERRSAITVYYPEKEESLWSIARRYNATVSAIAAENSIEGETTGDMKILFIPSV